MGTWKIPILTHGNLFILSGVYTNLAGNRTPEGNFGKAAAKREDLDCMLDLPRRNRIIILTPALPLQWGLRHRFLGRYILRHRSWNIISEAEI